MEWIDYLRFFGALALVLGLILSITWGIRRFAPQVAGASSGKRLRVIETLPLDAKHRLVLFRKDEAEHLMLVGGPATLVDGGAGTLIPQT